MSRAAPLWRQVQARAIAARAEGHDLRSIAAQLDVSFGTVHTALKHAQCVSVAAARARAGATPLPPGAKPQAGAVTRSRREGGAQVSDTAHPDGTRTVSIVGDLKDPQGQRVTSLEALLARFGVESEGWVVVSAKVKTWEAMRADKEADLRYQDGEMTGFTRDHGGLHVQTLYSVTATLAREPVAAAKEQLEALAGEYARRLAALAPAPAPTPLALEREAAPYALIINAADLHYGGYAPESQTGAGYDRASAAKLASAAVTHLLRQALALGGRPERVVLALNGDLAHVDTKGRTTTKGTPQDTDGAAVEIMLGAIQLAKRLIEQARGLAPVSVELTYGNHDEIFSALLRQHLAEVYAGVAGVSVNNHQRRTSTLKYGNSLLVFEHGDTFKPQGYGATLLAEARDALAGVKHIEVITGHLHTHHERDYGGFTHRQGMSIAGTDVWHDQHHYRSRRGMSAYLLSREHGITATLTAPVSALED